MSSLISSCPSTHSPSTSSAVFPVLYILGVFVFLLSLPMFLLVSVPYYLPTSLPYARKTWPSSITIWTPYDRKRTRGRPTKQTRRIPDGHHMAEDSARKADLEMARRGLRPTTRHYGCTMTMMMMTTMMMRRNRIHASLHASL